MRSFAAYWWKAVRRAFTGTYTLLGANIQKNVAHGVTAILAILVAGFAPQAAPMLGKSDWGAVIWAAGAIALFLFLFLVILANAPPELEAEASKAAGEREAMLQEEISALNARLASQPKIRMDDIRLDRRYTDKLKVYEMRVKNDGGGEVVGRVFAVRLQDCNGERIERIDNPIELHWRGQTADQRFFGDVDAYAGILQFDTSNPAGYFVLMAPTGFIPLLSDRIASYRQERILLTARVVFYNPDNQGMVATKERQISIQPDTAAPLGYQIITLPDAPISPA